jgi:hypothetical protein
LIDEGVDIVHRALDLASIATADHLVTVAPADNHIVVERGPDGTSLRLQSVSDLSIGMGLEISRVHEDGTVESSPPPPPIEWTPAFRFFRLSQGSRDLFDAFRNLFLGLEALLDELFPKQRNEGEKAWIKRALTEAAARSNFSGVTLSSGVVPLERIVDELYDVRVHLFHAKIGRTLIPDERVSYLKVAEAYPALLAVWIELLRGWRPTGRGSGVITYGGFKFMIENSYTGALVALGHQMRGVDRPDDPGVQTAWTVFASPAELLEVRPGRMAVKGRSPADTLPISQPVNRVAVTTAAHEPMIIGSLGDLTFEGVDWVEVIAVIRLVNLGQPRTEFS